MLSQYTYVGGILDCIKTPHMEQIQSQLDYYINHGKNTPKTGAVGPLEKKENLWVDTKSLCNDKTNGGFGCINIKDFFTGLKLSWLRRYAIQQIDDHWCDILDTECGITNKSDRIKILGWGAEFFTPIIKKKIPGISEFLQALQTLNRNWVTPKEEKDNRWLHQPIFYNCRIKISKTKGFPKKLTHTTPELLGLNNNIKTRSLRVIDFLNNNNLLPNNNTGNRIVAHVTGLSQNDFINTHEINQSFKNFLMLGKFLQITYLHIMNNLFTHMRR